MKCMQISPTCQDGFVCFKLVSPHEQAAVGEPGALPQAAQVVSQLTLRHLQHVHVGLAGDVHRVLHHAHLRAKIVITQQQDTHRKSSSSFNKSLVAAL